MKKLVSITLSLIMMISFFSVSSINASSASNFKGDLNGDRMISVTDYKLLRDYILDLSTDPEQLATGDINNDGMLTLKDLIELKYIILN